MFEILNPPSLNHLKQDDHKKYDRNPALYQRLAIGNQKKLYL